MGNRISSSMILKVTGGICVNKKPVPVSRTGIKVVGDDPEYLGLTLPNLKSQEPLKINRAKTSPVRIN